MKSEKSYTTNQSYDEKCEMRNDKSCMAREGYRINCTKVDIKPIKWCKNTLINTIQTYSK